MKKVLTILSELTDSDVDWMLAVGKRLSIGSGSVLIPEGQPSETLFLIIEGHFTVTSRATGNQPIAELGVGEVVGELSFLDEQVTSATVRATTNGQTWGIPKIAVNARLKQDVGFAARFYKALALFVSQRLRSTLSQSYSSGDPLLGNGSTYANEVSDGALDHLAVAGARFDWMMRRLRGVA